MARIIRYNGLRYKRLIDSIQAGVLRGKKKAIGGSQNERMWQLPVGVSALTFRLGVFEIVLNRMACTNAGCERGRRMLCTHMQTRRVTASFVEFEENAFKNLKNL